jgi:hypothetical protein
MIWIVFWVGFWADLLRPETPVATIISFADWKRDHPPRSA